MEIQPLLVREVIFHCPPPENTYISGQAGRPENVYKRKIRFGRNPFKELREM